MRLTTIGLLVALSATGAYAQDFDPMAMNQGVSMLEDSVANVLIKYGLEADVMALSLGQLAEISTLVVNTEGGTSDEIKRKIQVALDR